MDSKNTILPNHFCFSIKFFWKYILYANSVMCLQIANFDVYLTLQGLLEFMFNKHFCYNLLGGFIADSVIVQENKNEQVEQEEEEDENNPRNLGNNERD